MITKNLKKALEAIGFRYSEGASIDKHHAYGIYNGFLISVSETAGRRSAFINYKDTQDIENLEDFKEKFVAFKSEFPIIEYSFSDNGLTIISNGDIALFVNMLDKVTQLLSETSVKNIDYCSKCGNKFGTRKPKKVTNGKYNYIMCEHCALDALEESTNDVAKKNEELNSQKTIWGILGSIAFSVIGTLIYVALHYFVTPDPNSETYTSGTGFHYIFCAIGSLVALLSYVGYRLFCKKISPTAYITISATSLFFTAVGQYLGVVFGYIQNEILSISPSSKLFGILGDKHVWLIHLRNTVPSEISHLYTDYSAIFYKLLIISLMFAAVGAAIFLLTLRDKSLEKQETATIETLNI